MNSLNYRFLKLTSLTFCSALVALGCSTPRMATPEDMETTTDILEVQDRSSASGALVDESFRVGAYAVQDVDRDWNVRNNFSVPGYTEQKTRSGYAYEFRSTTSDWDAQCVATSGDKDVELSSDVSLHFEYSQLACRCRVPGKEVTLLLKNKRDHFEGMLVTESARFVVRPVYEREDGSESLEPVGYRADNACCGAPAGAVEVLKPGRIWLDRALSEAEREQLSCLFAGLMLFEPMDEQMR